MAAAQVNPPPFSDAEDVAFVVSLGADFVADYAASPGDLELTYAAAFDPNTPVVQLDETDGLELDADTGDLTVRIERGRLSEGRYQHEGRITRVSTDETHTIFRGYLTIEAGPF